MPYDCNAKHVAWAHRRKAELIELLGGHCVCCGATDALTIDHVSPRTRTWKTRDKGHKGSVLAYWRDYRAGVPLQVLCDHHNKVKNQKSWPEFQREIWAFEHKALAVALGFEPLPF